MITRTLIALALAAALVVAPDAAPVPEAAPDVVVETFELPGASAGSGCGYTSWVGGGPGWTYSSVRGHGYGGCIVLQTVACHDGSYTTRTRVYYNADGYLTNYCPPGWTVLFRSKTGWST